MSRCLFALALLTPLAMAAEPPVGATFDPAEDVRFPKCAHVLDVTLPPYSAKGDGKTDDTAALQKALDDTMGQHKIVYLPNGTYLVSNTLVWKNQNSQKRNAYGFNWVQGQNTGKTVLRLKDDTFTDPKKPQAVMFGGGFGSADWFHNYIQNLTFDTGKGNAGAVGLEFYSNNTGCLRDVAITSGDGKGVIGLDLAHRDMNGPLLVRNVRVSGFATGVRCGWSVNSQTLERVTLIGQSEVGLLNGGQCVSARGLKVEGEAAAVRADGFTVLLDCAFAGRGRAKDVPAVKVGSGSFFARNVDTDGYKTAIQSADPSGGTAGPKVAEYVQGRGSAPFDAEKKSLGLTVADPPAATWDDPKKWAVAENFGADPNGGKDSSDAIQKAIDSGASTVFLPGFYQMSKPVKVRGKVARIIGSGGWTDYLGKTSPNFIIGDGDAKSVTVEHMSGVNGGIEIDTARPVVVRSLGAKFIRFKQPADVFLEDVVSNDVTILTGQKVWARQLNIENEGTHLTNDGGQLWVLGYKTERGGTLLCAKPGSSTEVFGNFSYTTTAGKLAPMFRTDNASVFAVFHEVCYSGDPFSVLVDETGEAGKKVVKRGEGGLSPYSARPWKK